MARAAVPVAGEGQDLEAVPAEIAADARGRRAGDIKGGQDRTVSTRKGPVLTGVSAVKGGQERTVSVETPAKTPALNARAGREPQNH
jgi:hypothetical protein